MHTSTFKHVHIASLYIHYIKYIFKLVNILYHSKFTAINKGKYVGRKMLFLKIFLVKNGRLIVELYMFSFRIPNL